MSFSVSGLALSVIDTSPQGRGFDKGKRLYAKQKRPIAKLRGA